MSGSHCLVCRKDEVTELNAIYNIMSFVIAGYPDFAHRPEPNNSECYTPSSEPFRVYILFIVLHSCYTLEAGVPGLRPAFASLVSI
jgi:hypothetical protein